MVCDGGRCRGAERRGKSRRKRGLPTANEAARTRPRGGPAADEVIWTAIGEDETMDGRRGASPFWKAVERRRLLAAAGEVAGTSAANKVVERLRETLAADGRPTRNISPSNITLKMASLVMVTATNVFLVQNLIQFHALNVYFLPRRNFIPNVPREWTGMAPWLAHFYILPWVAIGQWLFGLENHTNVSTRMYLIRACFSVAYCPSPCLYLSVSNSREQAESTSTRHAASRPASGTTPPLASGKPVQDLVRVCCRLSPLASYLGRMPSSPTNST